MFRRHLEGRREGEVSVTHQGTMIAVRIKGQAGRRPGDNGEFLGSAASGFQPEVEESMRK